MKARKLSAILRDIVMQLLEQNYRKTTCSKFLGAYVRV